jgi:hypothetical protein
MTKTDRPALHSFCASQNKLDGSAVAQTSAEGFCYVASDCSLDLFVLSSASYWCSSLGNRQRDQVVPDSRGRGTTVAGIAESTFSLDRYPRDRSSHWDAAEDLLLLHKSQIDFLRAGFFSLTRRTSRLELYQSTGHTTDLTTDFAIPPKVKDEKIVYFQFSCSTRYGATTIPSHPYGRQPHCASSSEDRGEPG